MIDQNYSVEHQFTILSKYADQLGLSPHLERQPRA
jgi:hypothetical protein